MLKTYFIKSLQDSSLPLILTRRNNSCTSFNKLTGCGRVLNFMQIVWEICEKMSEQILDFRNNYDFK